MGKKDRSSRSKSMVLPGSKSSSDLAQTPSSNGSRVSFHIGSPGSENGGLQNGFTKTQTPSPSPSDKDGPIFCGHDQHGGFQVFDRVFDMPVDRVFEVMYTYSDMYQEFTRVRKMYDMDVPSWSSEPDENGNKTRILTYMLSLNYAIGPKSTKTIETQTLLRDSCPSERYLVEVVSNTPDVPYGNSFQLFVQFCLTRVNSRQTRVLSNAQIQYTGKVFGFMKSVIDKSVTHGTLSGYGIFADHIAAAAERYQSNNGVVMRKKTKSKRESKAGVTSSTAQGNAVPNQTSFSPSSMQLSNSGGGEGQGGGSAFATFIFICLVVLVFVNVFFYYNLRSLEYKTATLTDQSKPIDWKNSVANQEEFYTEELKRWKQVLSLSSQVLDKMKTQIDELESTLDQRILFKNTKS